MNIVLEKKDNLHALLNIDLHQEDYKEKVSDELKKIQRKAQLPGFRPGKVPMGIVNKMYGKSIKAEEINKILIDGIYKFLKDNELEVMGHPLPDQDAAENIDWESQTSFNFTYEIGLAPKVELLLSENIEVEYPKIVADAQTVETHLDNLRRRYGAMIQPEITEQEDMLYGEFAELEQSGTMKAEGHTCRNNLLIKYIADKDVREKLIGIKVGDVVEFNVLKAVENESEAASLLGLKKEELVNFNAEFRFTLEKISRIEPANLDQVFFDKVFPESGIQDESKLREAVAEQISQQYQIDADKHFRNEVMKTLIKESGLELPESFLKKWVVAANKDEYTPERIEMEFPKLADSFRWQLIENHLVNVHGIMVNDDEVTAHLEHYIKSQFKQYGQQEVEQSVIDGFVKRIKDNQEELKKVYDNLADQKLLALYKEKLKLKVVEFSFDDFVKFVTEKYQPEISNE